MRSLLPLLLLCAACGQPTYYPRPYLPPPDTGDAVDPVDPADTGEPEDLPCSESLGNDPVTLTVCNETGVAGELRWRDFACAEAAYHAIPAGGEVQQSTFPGHVWVVRDEAGGLLGALQLDDDPEPVWVVR